MALGDGIRRNIAKVEPSERALLQDAFIQLNKKFFPGARTDRPPGGVSFWFKQDEIHQATHVHHGPEFLPWHREIVNRLEKMLREIHPQLSLHYWDWTKDPRSIPEANLGGGKTGPLNLFTPEFMGFGGPTSSPIGPPWLSARYYDPAAIANPVPPASHDRDAPGGTPADPPREVVRFVSTTRFPESRDNDAEILKKLDYADMRDIRTGLEAAHDRMHTFIFMGGQHISFRDPFVFLLHSNVDRLFARWQTDPTHPERLVPDTVYGSESNLDVLVGAEVQNVNHNVEPWGTGVGEFQTIRPWEASHENLGVPHTYKHPSVVTPPRYDTNFSPCDGLKNRVALLENNIRSLQEALHNEEIPPPPRTPQRIAKVEAFIESQKLELSRQQSLLATCLAANP